MAKVLIITATFNEMITGALESGCKSHLLSHGVKESDIDQVYVPGAFEIPVAAAVGARSKKYDAIICIGCIIRGETPHFDIIANESARGLMNISVDTGLPIINGIITTENVDQALNRSGIKSGNKGREAASAALTMIHTMKALG